MQSPGDGKRLNLRTRRIAETCSPGRRPSLRHRAAAEQCRALDCMGTCLSQHEGRLIFEEVSAGALSAYRRSCTAKEDAEHPACASFRTTSRPRAGRTASASRMRFSAKFRSRESPALAAIDQGAIEDALHRLRHLSEVSPIRVAAQQFEPRGFGIRCPTPDLDLYQPESVYLTQGLRWRGASMAMASDKRRWTEPPLGGGVRGCWAM